MRKNRWVRSASYRCWKAFPDDGPVIIRKNSRNAGPAIALRWTEAGAFMITLRHGYCLRVGTLGILLGLALTTVAVARHAPAQEPKAISGTAASSTAHPLARARTDAGRSHWQWPLQGRVVLGFQPRTPGRRGIHILGRPGQTVRAAATGRVAYVGYGLPGYGRLIILQHSGNLLSAYRNLGRVLVRTGAAVQSGQTVGKLGGGRGNNPVLHFEILRNRQPVNPLILLPQQG